MVEVFKTSVMDSADAKMLVDQIQQNFIDYKVNFDLEDCDKILRVKCTTGTIHSRQLIDFISSFGFTIEILHDEIPTFKQLI
jgi:hypothetical protein